MAYVLLATILVPLVGGVAVGLIPGKRASGAWQAALVLSGVVLALTAWLWAAFDPSGRGMQFELVHPWVPGLGTSLHLGVDGLSLPMVFLTALLTFLAVIASRNITDRVREYHTLLLLLEAGLIGVFVALDLIVFYLFWEVVLIPMYFLIHIWGGPRRASAAIKFFIYTLVGSVVMLGGIIALYLLTGGRSFDLITLASTAGALAPRVQLALFAAFAVGLAVKVPIVPLHTWLPEAHVEAPTAVSVILAGVLLKMGSYGFLRFGPGLLPEGFKAVAPVLAVLAVISIVYGAAVALMQTDLKKLVAYSSISHMGYVMLGISAGTAVAIDGAIVQMFSHGLIAGLMFLLVGTIYERAHTRQIADFGGLARVVPVLAGTFVFAAFASLGLPGMSGFIGEFLVILGSFKALTAHSVIAGAAVMLTAGYLLWMLQRVVFGPFNQRHAQMPDMTLREAAAIAPLCVATLVVGVAPGALLGVVTPAAELAAKLVGS
jgi:NADH-quinone oxidoreductase subunit M